MYVTEGMCYHSIIFISYLFICLLTSKVAAYFTNTHISNRAFTETIYVLFNPQNKYPDLISDARGQGTYCAVSCADSKSRDRLLQSCKNAGKY